MALEELYKKSLVINMNDGMDEDGDPVVKRYSYANIRENATSDELLQAALAIANLYKGTAGIINTIDTNTLSN